MIRTDRCGNCGSTAIKILDGSKVDGMPGINYKVCDGCGWSRAITRRRGRERLNVKRDFDNRSREGRD
jgi:ribosomal protein S12